MELDSHGAVVMIKGEPGGSSRFVTYDLMDWNPQDELSASVMLASGKFTPVKLLSEELPMLHVPDDLRYKPKSQNRALMW